VSAVSSAPPSTIREASAELADGRCSSVELTEEALRRIADPAGQGRHSFIRLFRETALAEARSWDALRAAGSPLPPLA